MKLYRIYLYLIVAAGLPVFGAVNPALEINPRYDSRDGNSVDTANGAFIQEMTFISLQGARALNLDISYNSLLLTNIGHMGHGWSHQYEASLREIGDGRVAVRTNGNTTLIFQDAGGGIFTPENPQNKYTTLQRYQSGEWELVLQSGTKYYFSAGLSGDTYPVVSILNRNSHPITITHSNGRPSSVQEVISGKQFFLFYGLKAPKLLHYLVHGSDYTFLKYDRFSRLTRIYSPTRLKTVGTTSSIQNIPTGPQGITYTAAVTATDTDRLIRISASIDHPNYPSLQFFLTSPAGKTIEVKLGGGANLFLDDFMGEDLSGTWILKVIDNADDGQVGTIKSFSVRQTTTPANWVQYDYDTTPFHRITKISDAKGNTIASNAYDSAGRVVFQDDAREDNGAWRFEYEPQPNGDMLTKVYDRTAAANKTTYVHDSSNRLKTITDANNNTTQYAYYPNSLDRSKITDARGNSTEFTYDSEGHGFLTQVKEANGAITKFAYDETLIKDEDGDFDGGPRGNLTSVIDALNNKSSFTYEKFNNLASITNALGIQQSKVYDSNGQLIITVNKDADGLETAYTDGMLTSVNILDGPEEKIEYDASGRVVKLIDAEGNASYIEYDLAGNIIEKRNDLGETILSQYDHRNRLVAETDPEDNVTSYEYDGNGNILRIIDPLTNVTVFEYDGEDRLIRVTDNDNNSQWTRYDAVGQIIQQIDELGRSTSFTYDEVGNQLLVFGPTGTKISETVYNELNLPASHTDAYGNTTRFGYDLLGQLTSRTDPSGKVMQLRMDALGRLFRVFDPLGRDFRKIYTVDDVVEKISDAARKETSFTYTDKNQVETITTPNNSVTKIEYTGSGFISRYIPPSLKAQQYTYDAASRLQKVAHTTQGTPDIVYAYNKNGNPISIGTQDTSQSPVVPKITRSYDDLNRLVSNTDAEGNTVYYTYNAAGLVAKIIYPGNKTLSYSYDAAKRLKTITDWADRVTKYTWNVHNRVDSILFPNDTLRVMTYDDTGRLRTRTDFDAKGSIILGYEYYYDRNGYISSEQLHTDPIAYEPQPTTFTYDDDNRVISKNAVAITYDVDGNMVTGPISGQTASFEWDARNNLKKVGAITFNNDVEDRLVGWVDGAETVKLTTLEASDGSRILASDSSLGTTSRYIYGVGLAYEEVDGQIKVHHYDERGNTVALSDSSGRTSGALAYSPYGEIIGQSGDTDTLFKFGAMFGVATAPNGLNYMRFRWYSPEIKRFISIDSSLGDITLPGSLNRYSYAGNNPINFVDPDGEFLNALIGGVAGAIVGATVELVGSAIKGEPVNWNSVAAAAIGGAVQGALSASGFPIAGGALGSIVEDLTKDGLNGDSVDFGSVAVGAVSGAATGKAGSKIGRKFGRLKSKFGAKRALNTATKKGVFGGEFGQSKILLLNNPIKRLATKSATDLIKDQAGKAALKFPLKLGGRVLEDADGNTPASRAIMGLFGRTPKILQGATFMPTINIGQGGEYLHNQRHLEALSAADRPLPDTPLAISSF